jgi:hypothetical protein
MQVCAAEFSVNGFAENVLSCSVHDNLLMVCYIPVE